MPTKKAKPAPTPAPPQPETRGARRKRMTREKLLNAAFELMAERGPDAVAINEITEAADVGFGSFYNHFASREEIYAVLVDTVFEDFADMLEELTANVEDPAETISICIQHTVLRARREPLWGRLLTRVAPSLRMMEGGLGVRLLRDMQMGIDQGRFTVPDPIMSFLATAGGAVTIVAAGLLADSGASPVFDDYGFEQPDYAQRAAAALLHGLGLSFEEAKAVAERPLPPAR